MCFYLRFRHFFYGFPAGPLIVPLSLDRDDCLLKVIIIISGAEASLLASVQILICSSPASLHCTVCLHVS